MKSSLFILAALSTAFSPASGAVTKVGNGDDGRDLEGFIELKEGPIVSARAEAVRLVKSLNVSAIRGLGALVPELEGTRLYQTKKDSSALESADSGTFHADMKGRVYARTFAEPHAATRFFPVAEKLESDQLAALHVHEALHRALPAAVREDESVVSGITLAVTSPGASFDTVERTVARLVPASAIAESTPASGITPALSTSRYPIPESARVRQPSEFSYSYRAFQDPKRASAFRVDSMHVLRTDLYPFGSDESPLGIGIEAALIQRPNASLIGPLSLARGRLWSARGFDIGAWGAASLNTLSAEELKSSQFGRDTFSFGLSMRKDLSFFSVENFLGYTLPGRTDSKIGNVAYQYSYGSVVSASTHPAVVIGPFRVGAFAEMNLGDYYRMNSVAFNEDSGRYRIVSGGPEVQFRSGNLALGVSGRFLIDATRDASFDTIGDLMGPGSGQGNVAGTLSIFF